MDGQIRERLIAKGNKAINDGQVAIIINAAGQGEDSEFFEKSKIWNKPDWSLDQNYFEFLMEKVKSITKSSEDYTELLTQRSSMSNDFENVLFDLIVY